MYSEKARLNSPRKTGPQRMEFLYSMYSSTIETLSVYIKINGSEYRVWSRHGSQLSSDWIIGCVTLNYQGTYQVKTYFLYQLFCVCLFVCLCFVAPFYCGGFPKITSLCHLSWLASAFSNCRKYIAKYSRYIYSSSDTKYFFFPRNKTNRHSRLSKFSINLRPPLSTVIFPL